MAVQKRFIRSLQSLWRILIRSLPTWVVLASYDGFWFDLLIGRSLKHVKTGKCIHTSGAWPAVNRNMVLWSGCNEQRLELWFSKQGKSIFQRTL